MGKLILENLDEGMLERLRELASAAGETPEQKVVGLIASAVDEEARRKRREELLRRMERTGAMTPPGFSVDMTQLIREDRDR